MKFTITTATAAAIVLANASAMHLRATATLDESTPLPPSIVAANEAWVPHKINPVADVPRRYLNYHNYLRCLHGAPPLEWDANIAAGAQETTDHMMAIDWQGAHIMEMIPPGVSENYINNNAGGWIDEGGDYKPFETGVDAFYDEWENCMDSQCTSSNGKQIGHFRIMIRKSVTKLGCGLSELPLQITIKDGHFKQRESQRILCRYGGHREFTGDNIVKTPFKSEAECAHFKDMPFGATPPTNPPTHPPTNPPTHPPTNPPTHPPTHPPTNPPTHPPTNPPTHPPTQTNPPTNPPTHPPTNPPVAEPAHPPQTLPETPPPAWTCADAWYNADDGCDCKCGVLDPDCLKPNFGIMWNCRSDERCDENAQCAPK